MNKTVKNQSLNGVYITICSILERARSHVIKQVNSAMVLAYWNIGKTIVEEEQRGKEHAEYGIYLLTELAKRLTAQYGKGFTETNLKYMRLFYIKFQTTESTSLLTGGRVDERCAQERADRA